MTESQEEYSEEIAVEAEDTTSDIVKPFDPKKVNITTKPLTLDALIERIGHDEIDLVTDFQRKADLWDQTKQSRLIESILIRFPLPAFYFDGSNDSRWLVVDGLQRLSTLRNFVIEKKLKLTNLEFLKDQFDKASYDDLPRELQRRIRETQVTAYIINEGTPEEVKFNLFKRINTGGLILEPQEIRHALNQGVPANFIKELAEVKEFREATGYSIKSDRMLDRDFANRFVAFYLTDYRDYKPDLDTFLNDKMAFLKELPEKKRIELKEDFIKAMIYSRKIFKEHAFRKRYELTEGVRRRPINKALFEVWSVTLSKLSYKDLNLLQDRKEELNKMHIHLINHHEKYFDSISSGTGDSRRVLKRFSVVEKLIQKVLQNDYEFDIEEF